MSESLHRQLYSTPDSTHPPYPHLLPNANIHCMIEDSEGYLWYGTERGGLCRDNGYQVDVFRPSDESGLPASDCISCLKETPDGNIIIGTYDGLFLLSKDSYTIKPWAFHGL